MTTIQLCIKISIYNTLLLSQIKWFFANNDLCTFFIAGRESMEESIETMVIYIYIYIKL